MFHTYSKVRYTWLVWALRSALQHVTIPWRKWALAWHGSCMGATTLKDAAYATPTWHVTRRYRKMPNASKGRTRREANSEFASLVKFKFLELQIEKWGRSEERCKCVRVERQWVNQGHCTNRVGGWLHGGEFSPCGSFTFNAFSFASTQNSAGVLIDPGRALHPDVATRSVRLTENDQWLLLNGLPGL